MKSTSVIGHLTDQRARAVKTAEGLLRDVTPARALSFSHADAVESSIDDAVRAADRLERAAVVVRSEPLTYRADSPYSFFLDAVSATLGSAAAEMRIARHRREMTVESERRDVLRRRAFAAAAEPLGMERRDLTRVDGAGGGFAPPLWLVDQLGAFPRAGRVVAYERRSLGIASLCRTVRPNRCHLSGSRGRKSETGLTGEPLWFRSVNAQEVLSAPAALAGGCGYGPRRSPASH